mgnify:CR=1 FL=1
MEGSEILTTPLTITGSIGVISGWLHDDGLAGKAGITSDVVSRGEHADLFTTVNIPFIGGVPRRAMNEDELARGEGTEYIIDSINFDVDIPDYQFTKAALRK